MSDNDLSSKLAKGMRRAKEPASGPTTPAAPTPAGSAPSSAPTAASNVAVQSNSGGLPGARPAPGGRRFADQGDQTPPASLDRPWENLHPKRIWPD